MAKIYCYTSTGNSLYLAKEIAKIIAAQVNNMRGKSTVDDEVIGLIFPCFFWGLPRQTAELISGLNVVNKQAYIFCIVCSGGPVFGVLGLVKQLLQRKGLKLNYGKRVVSVSNYLPAHEIEVDVSIKKKMDKQVEAICQSVIKRRTNRVFSVTMLNELFYQYYPPKDSDVRFSVSENCDGCGTCSQLCPVSNITIEVDRPCFSHNCDHCLSCLHNCPKQAIDWDNKTQGRNRYRNNKISLLELLAFNKEE